MAKTEKGHGNGVIAWFCIARMCLRLKIHIRKRTECHSLILNPPKQW